MYSKKINQLATNLNPQSTDLIPIGDAETGQLKTTTFDNISGISGDGVISGGIVTWTGTGLIFNISACTYVLNGIRYSSPFTTKTLDAADPTYDRIDVFAVNTSGQVEVIKGTPALNPVEPEGDTATTLGLTNVTIVAGATTPNNVSRDLIYDENVESWSHIASVTPGSYNFADTAYANTGTKSILITQGAGFTLLKFSKATAMDISSYKSVSFAIRLNTAWTSNQILAVTFYNGTNQVSNTYQLTSTNKVGFNRNLGATWQTITIPLDGTLLKFKSNQFTEFRILTTNAATTYRLDTIQLNSGINNPTGTTSSNSFGFVNGSTGTATATTATDTLNVVGTGLATTSATDKTLTIAVPTPIPSQTGNTGKFLTTNGSVVSWGTPTDTGITSLNSLTGTTQTFATGTTGTDFGISSTGTTHTFNIPTASSSNRGLLSTSDWTLFNAKESALTFNSPLSRSTNTISIPAATSSVNGYLSSTDWSAFNAKQNAITLTTTGTSGAATLVGSTLNIPQYSGSGMAIGGSITSATTGSVLFAGTSGVLQQDNANFFWDDTNNRLGIGTASPACTIDVPANNTSLYQFRVGTFNLQSSVLNNVFLSDNIYYNGTSWTRNTTGFGYGFQFFNGQLLLHGIASGTGTFTQNIKFKFDQEGAFVIGNNLSSSAGTYTGATALFTKNGRLLLGTTTELSNILEVNGSSSFTGNATIIGNATFGTIGTGTGMYWDNSNNRLGIGTDTPNYTIDIPANSTNNIQFRVGTFNLQSSALNNGYIFDNAYYNGTSWTRTSTGYAVGFQYYNGQALFHGAASGTGTFTANNKFKFDYEGAFVIGNNISAVQGNYTGATALFTKNGRLLLGTTTESTYILDVNGTTRFQGNVTASTKIFAGTTDTTSTRVITAYTTTAASQIIAIGTTPTITFTNTIASPTVIGSVGCATVTNDFVTGTSSGDMVVINQVASKRLYCVSNTGGVYLTSAATSWTANSDITLKNINSYITDAVNKLMNLSVINYHLKDDTTKKEQIGLIAQEVKEVLPEIIETSESGILGLRYTELIPVLVKAIQELKEEINILKNK